MCGDAEVGWEDAVVISVCEYVAEINAQPPSKQMHLRPHAQSPLLWFGCHQSVHAIPSVQFFIQPVQQISIKLWTQGRW